MDSFPYLERVCCSMSSSNCCFLTRIQVSHEAGQVVWYFHLFQEQEIKLPTSARSSKNKRVYEKHLFLLYQLCQIFHCVDHNKLWKILKEMTNLDGILKSRDITCQQGLFSQSYGFSSSHVWMWELDCEESWAPKNLCFWTVVLEKTLESPLDCKEIKPVNPKGN